MDNTLIHVKKNAGWGDACILVRKWDYLVCLFRGLTIVKTL